ncbi:lytic transglycosylase domain-containing protein [Speluncibacter jeojiensis]|uniref:Lytic transglycosylase domain-containing protein n=1 Tax=Speluncibacter jeojiensis TaxID=2710754 RepID=A0A9X4MAB7_9ACTN|nr:lytic transglycosylase domain-containing protein [Corynebacteriales bacterium D3-21]
MIAAITPCGLIAAAGSGGNSGSQEADAPRVVIADLAASGAPGTQQARPLTPAALPPAPTPPAAPAQSMPALGAPALLTGPAPVGLRAIPVLAMAAYQSAADRMNSADPNCHITAALLAGIGKVESDHGDGGRFDLHGNTLNPILGPVLDGHLPGNEVVRNAGGGFERAVGPMQFMPATWAKYGADGNGDGKIDPNNIFDASYGAARLLCSSGKNLAVPSNEFAAILSYNHSAAYAQTVLAWATAYSLGVDAMPMASLPSLIDAADYSDPSSGLTGVQPVDNLSLPTPPPAVPPAPAPAPVPAAPALPGLPAIPGLPATPGLPIGLGSSTLPPLPCLIFCPPPAASAPPALPPLPVITLPPLPCLIFCPPPVKPGEPAADPKTAGADPKVPGVTPAPARLEPAAVPGPAGGTAPSPLPAAAQSRHGAA